MVEYDERVLRQVIAAEAPGLAVSFKRTPHGLLLEGSVPTAEAAAHLEDVARGYVGPGERLVDHLQVSSSTQVNLRVRVAEVSRSVSRELGYNWNTVFSNIGSFAPRRTPTARSPSTRWPTRAW